MLSNLGMAVTKLVITPIPVVHAVQALIRMATIRVRNDHREAGIGVLPRFGMVNKAVR